MKTWTKPFVHKNRFYEALFSRIPLRDRMECCVDVKGQPVRVTNQGLGAEQELPEHESSAERHLDIVA